MPESPPLKTVVLPADVTPPVIIVGQPLPPPPEGFISWCDWAQKGLANALQGMVSVGSGVKGYTIGSRKVEYHGPADQVKNVDYWNQMVKFYCGIDGLPSSLTGRDAVCRIIPRDV